MRRLAALSVVLAACGDLPSGAGGGPGKAETTEASRVELEPGQKQRIAIGDSGTCVNLQTDPQNCGPVDLYLAKDLRRSIDQDRHHLVTVIKIESARPVEIGEPFFARLGSEGAWYREAGGEQWIGPYPEGIVWSVSCRALERDGEATLLARKLSVEDGEVAATVGGNGYICDLADQPAGDAVKPAGVGEDDGPGWCAWVASTGIADLCSDEP